VGASLLAKAPSAAPQTSTITTIDIHHRHDCLPPSHDERHD